VRDNTIITYKSSYEAASSILMPDGWVSIATRSNGSSFVSVRQVRTASSDVGGAACAAGKSHCDRDDALGVGLEDWGLVGLVGTDRAQQLSASHMFVHLSNGPPKNMFC
jgi:hypothetical protein